jgi:peptide/nickel transport system substrate-binding protein
MGVKSKAIDAMCAAIVAARSREELVAAARVLDRLLMSGIYVVPLFHLPEIWIARWPWIGRPATPPLTAPLIDSWWRVPESSHTGPMEKR